MRYSEGQRRGAAALVVLCLLLHGLSRLQERLPPREAPLAWGVQRPDTPVIAIRGSRAADGVYFLPPGTTFGQLPTLVALPEGFRGGREAAATVPDGSLLRFDAAGGLLAVEQIGAALRLALGLKVDLNRASLQDLLLIPGIGESTAERILQLRRTRGGFDELSDLLAVPGIKERRLAALREFLLVRGAAEAI